MDIRLARILAERGSNHPEAVALRRLMATSRQARVGRGRRGRIKYMRPQDLARLPRNPVEKKARKSLSLVMGIMLRMEKLPKYAITTQKKIEADLKAAKEYEEYLREAARIAEAAWIATGGG